MVSSPWTAAGRRVQGSAASWVGGTRRGAACSPAGCVRGEGAGSHGREGHTRGWGGWVGGVASRLQREGGSRRVGAGTLRRACRREAEEGDVWTSGEREEWLSGRREEG